MQTSYYSEEELREIGLKRYGKDVRISRKTSIYKPETIAVGSHVRIDDFCILSGSITISDYVHVNPYTGMYGGVEGIILGSFVNLSSNVTIYAVCDDYSGEYMTSPLIPEKYTGITNKRVRICNEVIIGTGSTVLPGVTINEGCAIGAMSLVKNDLNGWTIYAGIPVKPLHDRLRTLQDLEKEFLKNE